MVTMITMVMVIILGKIIIGAITTGITILIGIHIIEIMLGTQVYTTHITIIDLGIIIAITIIEITITEEEQQITHTVEEIVTQIQGIEILQAEGVLQQIRDTLQVLQEEVQVLQPQQEEALLQDVVLQQQEEALLLPEEAAQQKEAALPNVALAQQGEVVAHPILGAAILQQEDHLHLAEVLGLLRLEVQVQENLLHLEKKEIKKHYLKKLLK